MLRIVLRNLTAVALLGLMVANTVTADPPVASYVFPAGGQRGTEVDLRVGGLFLLGPIGFHTDGSGLQAAARLEPMKTLWFEGPLLYKPASQKAEDYPLDYRGHVSISPSAALGPKTWQLSTSQGITPGRSFLVGALPEIVEREIEGDPIPQKVSLPVTVNGRIFPREDVDIWTIPAVAGKPITVEVMAARMGSPLDSRIQVNDPSGRIIAENTDYHGTDSYVRFTPQQTGMYSVHIHDIGYGGLQDHVYRLTMTSDTYVDQIFPLGGRRGVPTAFQLVGQAVPNDRVTLTIPTVDDDDWYHAFEFNGQPSNTVRLAVSDYPEYVETDTAPHAITPPTVLNGRIQRPGEVDEWPIELEGGVSYRFDVAAAKLGSTLDAVLSLHDRNIDTPLLQWGSQLAERVDPTTTWTPESSGTYFVQIAHVDASTSDHLMAYRLTVEPLTKSEFRLSVTADSLIVERGKTMSVNIDIDRRGTPGKPVRLRALGLPDQVTAEEIVVPADKDQGSLTLTAAPDTRVQIAELQFEGRFDQDNAPWQRAVRTSGVPHTEASDTVRLSVAMPTPFRFAEDEYQKGYASRGTPFRRHLRLERNGYEGEFEIRLCDRQVRHRQGVTAAPQKFGAEVTDFVFPIRIPPRMEMNRLGRILVMAIGDVRDEDGKVHKVSYSSQHTHVQYILLTAPCPIGLRVQPATRLAVPNSTVNFELTVQRGQLGSRPVDVEAIVPTHMQGVTSRAITIPANQDTGTLQVQLGHRPGPLNMPITIRASLVDDHNDRIVTDAQIQLVPAEPLAAD